MRQDHPVWGRAARRDAVQQRGLEPAAVLVAALEVEVGGPAEVLPVVEDGGVARTGVEPYVHDVGVLAQMLAFALRAYSEVADKLFGRHRPPAVAAVLAHLLRDAAHAVAREDDLAAVLAVEGRYRNAPRALAADAPVGAVAHHVRDAVLAPVGYPFYFVDALERLVAEFRDGDEPLVRGAEDDRLLAAPAVRVGVRDFQLSEQAARFFEKLEDLLLALGERHAAENRRVGVIMSSRVHGVVDLYAVADARLIVVASVAGGGVDASGTGVERDVVGEHERNGSVVERVLRERKLKLLPLADEDRLAELKPGSLLDLGLEADGDEVDLAAALVEAVVVARMNGDRHRGGKRPRRRRPDYDVDVLSGELGEDLRGVGVLVSDEDRGRSLVSVLDFRRGERRLAVGAPVDRLASLVDEPLVHHFGEAFELSRLERRDERHVRMLPVADDAEALKLSRLHIGERTRVGGALLAQLDGRDFVLADVQLLENLELDGEPVRVVARNVWREVSALPFILNYEVLENLVRRGSDMDARVRVGRPVVKDERGLVLVLFLQLAVNVDVVPEFEKFRLPLRQIRAHREIRLGQEQRVLIVVRHKKTSV